MLTPEQIAAKLADRNPFSTRCVRPGALSFRFTNGMSAERLVEQLQERHWTGEIVGPHGSGKSTLIRTLIPLIEAAGRDVKLFTAHRGESRLPISGKELQSWGPSTQIVIDGYEQLGNWTRTLVNRICKTQGSGLLITTHESLGFPTLFRTSATLDLAQALVRDIQPAQRLHVTDEDVAASFRRQEGNIREMFFELYDVYEQRKK